MGADLPSKAPIIEWYNDSCDRVLLTDLGASCHGRIYSSSATTCSVVHSLGAAFEMTVDMRGIASSTEHCPRLCEMSEKENIPSCRELEILYHN